MKVRTWLALTLAGAGLFARAELAVSGGEIRPGEWNSRFVAAKEYAEAHNTPMLAIWSSTGCGWCRLLREACQNAEFVRWQNERKLVMVACHDKDQPDDYACWQFIRNETGAFPYVGIYWPKQNGASVKVLFSGRASYFPNKTSNTLYGRLIDSVEDAIEGWDPTRPAYVGGEFLATNTPSACLEADVGTTFVRVPLVRQPNACGVAAVNRLTVTYPNGRTASHEVRWAAGDRTNMATRIELPAGTFSAAGQEIGLRLQDDKGQEVSRSVIAYAPDRENSPKNPLWIGERSAETLLFGEWTMDLDVATNKTAATAGAAHTLVLIGGSTWCPDCVKTDAYLIDTPQFKTWARDNRISCVAIDVPKMNKDTPSLLTYDPVVTSDRYVTSTTPHQDRVQAGAGYLSRKMIEPAAAAAVAARNHHLLYDSTLQGGLCRPEKMQNTFKTGIPCLILLRKDGTVAGRLDQFNDVSPDRFNPAHIDRLNELLAASEDLNEESNADWSSTRMSIAVPGSASGTLSAMDLTDVFRIEDVRNGYSHRFALTGDGESGEEDVRASIIRVKDGAAEVVKSATGALADGVSVQSVLETASGARYYLKLEALAGSEAFSIDREGDSTRSYSVTSRSVPNPGRISFVQEAQTLAENGDGGSVRVRRAGGSSGACTVLLAVDASSTASVGRYALDAQTVTWADGEQGEKSVRFRTILNSTFEGRQTVVLALQTVSGAECAADLDSGTHVVTIMDSDTPCFARSQYEVDTYLSVEDSVEFDLYNLEAGSVQVKKVEGKGLPSGMKLKVVDGKAVLSGVPKKAGTYTVAYVVRNGRVTGSERTTLTINVSDPSDRNPFMGQRRKAVVPLMIQLGGGKVLAGELTVSITSAGAISARYAGTESAKVSFKGTWNSFDAETGVAASVMVARNGGTLGLELHPDGTLRVRLAGVASALAEDGAAVAFEGVAGDVTADLKSAFDGYYTVTLPVRTSAPTMLPTGTGYLTLTIKSGGVRYAGLAANGTKLSGSGTLQGNSEEVAALGVFKRLSKDVFGIPMEIRKNASETCTDIERLQVINTADGEIAYCLHRENGVSAMSVADVFGGYYLQDKSPDAICGIFGIDPLLALTFGVNQYAAGDEGVITSAPAALMRADDKGFAFESMGALTSFKFTRKTGLFSGNAKIGFANGRTVSGKFKGVLLPGWFGQCDECGEPVPGGLVTRPFASGLFWFKGSVGGKRVTRSLSVDIDSYVAE